MYQLPILVTSPRPANLQFQLPMVNLQFKNMKWEILKINNSCFKLLIILSDEILHPPALSA